MPSILVTPHIPRKHFIPVITTLCLSSILISNVTVGTTTFSYNSLFTPDGTLLILHINFIAARFFRPYPPSFSRALSAHNSYSNIIHITWENSQPARTTRSSQLPPEVQSFPFRPPKPFFYDHSTSSLVSLPNSGKVYWKLLILFYICFFNNNACSYVVVRVCVFSERLLNPKSFLILTFTSRFHSV